MRRQGSKEPGTQEYGSAEAGAARRQIGKSAPFAKRERCRTRKTTGEPALGSWDAGDELGAKGGDGLATHQNAVAEAFGADGTAASGGLKPRELVAAKALPPERRQAAMGRASDRVFVDAAAGAKKRETKS